MRAYRTDSKQFSAASGEEHRFTAYVSEQHGSIGNR